MRCNTQLIFLSFFEDDVYAFYCARFGFCGSKNRIERKRVVGGEMDRLVKFTMTVCTEILLYNNMVYTFECNI